jgi:hypothetical protein
MGAAGLVDVEIVSCQFQQIGLAVPEERLPEALAGFGFSVEG